MDQNKNQGQGKQGQQTQGQGDQGQGNQSQDPNRDQAEDQRQQAPGRDQSRQPGQQFSPRQGGNRGNQGERNSSSSGGGISNRGMDKDEEQEDVPVRGSERRDRDDSER